MPAHLSLMTSDRLFVIPGYHPAFHCLQYLLQGMETWEEVGGESGYQSQASLHVVFQGEGN